MNWLSKVFGKRGNTAASAATLQLPPVEEPLDGDRQAALAADNPVRQTADDRLGRTRAAESFASSVLQVNASDGVVVGVLGAWGSGKTSFINLARPTFQRSGVPILDFNPWMFSGAEQLVQSLLFGSIRPTETAARTG